jgi:hypothetical protein
MKVIDGARIQFMQSTKSADRDSGLGVGGVSSLGCEAEKLRSELLRDFRFTETTRRRGRITEARKRTFKRFRCGQKVDKRLPIITMWVNEESGLSWESTLMEYAAMGVLSSIFGPGIWPSHSSLYHASSGVPISRSKHEPAPIRLLTMIGTSISSSSIQCPMGAPSSKDCPSCAERSVEGIHRESAGL